MGFLKSKDTATDESYLQYLKPLGSEDKPLTIIEKLISGEIQVAKLDKFPADFCKDDNYRIEADLSNDDYHAMTEYDSSSRLKSVFKSELHYINYSSGKATAAMNLGTCIHTVFEDIINNDCEDLWSCLDLWNVKETKTTCIPETRTIARPYFQLLSNLLKEIERLGLIDLLKNSFSEVSFFSEGTKERVRPDIWIPLESMPFDYMISVKSVSNVAKFKNQIRNFHYDMSEGMYITHLEKALKKDIRLCFLLVDTSNNGMIQLVEIDDETASRYVDKYKEARRKIDNIDRDNPKGYPVITI